MDRTYFNKIIENLEKVNETQSENIKKAASLMADAIASRSFSMIVAKAKPLNLLHCRKVHMP